MHVWLKVGTVFWGLGMAFVSLPLAAEMESPESQPEFPKPDDRGDYQPMPNVHPTWEIVDRGLSGLNCYQTFPPNQGSHLVVSRLFSGQVLEASSGDEVWVESRGKTWLSVRDPWSGQACWVRAHQDFIKPIVQAPEAIQSEELLGAREIFRCLRDVESFQWKL